MNLSYYFNTFFNVNSHEDEEIVAIKKLRRSSEKLDEMDNQGYSRLHAAINKERNDIVELLIAKGADINVADAFGSNCLHAAIQKNNIGIVSTLCKAGINVNIFGMSNHAPSPYFTCLHLAIHLHLTSHLNLTTGSTWVPTAKHISTYAKKLAIIEILCEHGANIDAANDVHSTPLHLAVIKRELAVVELLCKRGAKIDEPNYRKKTAIRSAIDVGDSHIIEILVRYGANLNNGEQNYFRPLQYAIRIKTDVQTIKTLISCNADVNVKDSDGWTSLHWALDARSNFETIEELILAGAETNIENSYGNTALELLMRCTDQKIIEMVEEVAHGNNARIKSARTNINAANIE